MFKGILLAVLVSSVAAQIVIPYNRPADRGSSSSHSSGSRTSSQRSGSTYSNYRSRSQSQRSAECGRKDGYYVNGNQCDAYVRCVDGNVVETGLCPDGQVFNEYSDPKRLACQLPFGVDCSDRPNLQPAQPNGECPRQYAMVGQCQNFIICDEGNAKYFKCPEGLAFNDTIGVCDWGDRVPSCQLEQVLGFTCPEPTIDQLTLFGDHARYPHADDPTRFYVCMRWNANGEPNLTPRVHTCESGLQFDPESSSCKPAPTGSGRSGFARSRK